MDFLPFLNKFLHNSWIVHEAIFGVMKYFREKLCEVARAVARKSGGIFRYQPHAPITIPTSVGMNIAATVSTGDLNDEIMIGE
jgi:hypothetical protein